MLIERIKRNKIIEIKNETDCYCLIKVYYCHNSINCIFNINLSIKNTSVIGGWGDV